MYVHLKHSLSALALEALRRPVRRAAVGWLVVYCDLAERQRDVSRHPAGQERFVVPLAAVAAGARRQGVKGSAGLRWATSSGLLATQDEALSLPAAFRPYFPYMNRQVHRLAVALRALARGPRLRGDRAVVQRGAALFNAGLFFECHEFLEGAWRNAPAHEKPFYHGVILVAAAFYHHEKGNLHGARIKLTEGMKLLERFLPTSHGVRLEQWLSALGPWKDRLDVGQVTGVLRASEIPRIPLLTARVRRK